jgi:hypothetical protein
MVQTKYTNTKECSETYKIEAEKRKKKFAKTSLDKVQNEKK